MPKSSWSRLRDQENDRNERLCQRHNFDHYTTELERLAEKRNSEQLLTKRDSLTRIIMRKELGFDLEE